jgi:ABC-type transport system involved in multi-copper enzyme maturation permease subunit
MLPGPICSVEMLTIARRARYFLVRALYAGVLLLFLWYVYYEVYGLRRTNSIGVVANFTAAFFGVFSIVQLLVVLLLGPALAAGTIAVERERRTIEYLFASPLSNLEIVLGKLTARTLHTVYLVLAGVPVLALAMLQGGIAPEALLLLMVLTLSTIVMVAALSIAVSVWTARARDAVVRAYLVMLALLALPPMAFASQRSAPTFYAIIAPVNDHLLLADPLWVFNDVLSLASSSGPGAAWLLIGQCVRNQLTVAALALGAATLAVRRVHLKESGKAQRRRRWRFQLFRAPLGSRPMLWKELFAEPAASRLGVLGYAVLAIVLVALIWMTVYVFLETISRSYSWRRHGEEYLSYAAAVGTLIASGSLLLLASRAASSITSEKERQSWDSLLSTPLTAHEIVGAKVLGNVWACRWLMVPLAIIWVPGVLVNPKFLLAIPFLLATFFVLAFFVSSLGVLLSLRAKNSLRAMASTLAICIFIGGGYLFCCMFAFLSGPGPGSGAEIIMAPCAPFLLAFPTVMTLEGPANRRELGAMIFAYGLGMIGYFVAALVLYLTAVDRFDSLAGRTVRVLQQGRDAPPENVILAELVDPRA